MSATHESRRPGGRYSTVSILLHWLLAVLLVVQVFVGGWFEDLPRENPQKGEAFALHASLGVTILLLSLARLGWRLTHPAPPLPSNYPAWQRVLARATHVGFYVVMIGMPLTGWIMASRGNGFPDVWGVIPWFELPNAGEGGREIANVLHHDVILKLFYVLLALHVAGALKHQFMDRDGTLARMLPLPGVGPRPR